MQASTYPQKALENRMFALESVKTIIGKNIARIEIEELQCHWTLVNFVKGAEHQREASARRTREGIDIDAFQAGVPTVDLGLIFQRIDQ